MQSNLTFLNFSAKHGTRLIDTVTKMTTATIAIPLPVSERTKKEIIFFVSDRKQNN